MYTKHIRDMKHSFETRYILVHFGDGEKNVQNELFGEIFQIVRFLKIEDILRKSSANEKNS